jgi:DNA-binding transcriptional MerR regulator
MSALPLADGARLLGIHPKTLHHWLKEANVPFTAHPSDARIKCVTEHHLQQVARLHSRPFQASVSPPLVPSQAQTPHTSGNEVEPASTGYSLPSLSTSEVDLIQKLSCLETKVVTLQQQLAQLALARLEERERSVERGIWALEPITAELVGRPISPYRFQMRRPQVPGLSVFAYCIRPNRSIPPNNKPAPACPL